MFHTLLRVRILPLFVFTLFASGCSTTQPHTEVAHASATTIAPVELFTLEGQPTPLSTFLAGRAAVVNLWATWCEACVEELGALSQLDEQAKARGALVVGIDEGESRATVLPFVKAHKMSYAQLLDEQFHFADALGQRRVPATLVIDRAGHIDHIGGALDEEALAAFARVLANPPAVSAAPAP